MYQFSKFKIVAAGCGVIACSVSGLESAYAEGGGKNFSPWAFGVNRVIRTNEGYIGFSGSYELEFSSPTNLQGAYETKEDKEKVTLLNTATQSQLDPGLVIENRPSAYIGGRFLPVTTPAGVESEVDTGLQLEVATKFKVPPGWSIFFYVADAFYYADPAKHRFPAAGSKPTRLELNPRVFKAGDVNPYGSAWRPTEDVDKFGKIQGTMSIEATKEGRARVSCSSLPSPHAMWVVKPLPPVRPVTPPLGWKVDAANTLAPNNVSDTSTYGSKSAIILFEPSELKKGKIKRVTAMTRPNGGVDHAPASPIPNGLNGELDGSWLKARWFNCKLTKLDQNGNEVEADWKAVDVLQSGTGYDVPGGDGDWAFDKRYKAKVSPMSMGGSPSSFISRHIVEFAPIDKVTPGVPPNPDTHSIITNQQLRAGVGDESRYKDETVIINLGMIARPIGESVK